MMKPGSHKVPSVRSGVPYLATVCRQARASTCSSIASASQVEMAQGLHLLLEVVLGNPGQAFAQLSGQLRRQRRLEQPAFVEQLIEQQRKAGDLFGDPWARCTQGQP